MGVQSVSGNKGTEGGFADSFVAVKESLDKVSTLFHGKVSKKVQNEVTNSIAAMETYLSSFPREKRVLTLIDALGKSIVHHKIHLNDGSMASLERVRLSALLGLQPEFIEKIKSNWKTYFKTEINRELFEKWKKEGFAEEAFFWNPTVPPFIFKAHLHHSVKQYGDAFQYDEKTHEFKILMDGAYTNVAKAAEELRIEETTVLGRKLSQLVSKVEEKWSYVPQKGLTKRDETTWKKLEPFAHLSETQVAFAQEHASGREGQPGKKGDYVVEIITSRQKYTEIPLASGYQETFCTYKHPWIRIITPDGDLYSVGFNIGEELPKNQPAALVHGFFRSPDLYETLPYDQRLIAGFAVDKKTCDEIIEEIKGYQGKETSFNMIEKNCTAFIERIKDILVTDPKKRPTFSADFPEVFRRCLPTTIQKIGRKITPTWTAITDLSWEFFPPIVKKVCRVVAGVFRLIAERTAIAFSGRWLDYRKDDAFPQQEVPHKKVPWYRILTRVDNALKKRLVRTYLPRKVGEWLEGLPQTRRMEKSAPLFTHYRDTSDEGGGI